MPDPLHPTGRCTCFGEGRCEWCLKTPSPTDAEEDMLEAAEAREPVNPLLPCGHRRKECPGGCESSPHDPATAEALLVAGFTADADLGQAVRHLVMEIDLPEGVVLDDG